MLHICSSARLTLFQTNLVLLQALYQYLKQPVATSRYRIRSPSGSYPWSSPMHRGPYEILASLLTTIWPLAKSPAR